MSAEDVRAVLMVLESTFPSPGGGGAESQVRTLGLEFLRRGLALEVVVPMVAGGPQLRDDEVDGIPVTRIPYPKVRWVGAFWMLLSLAGLLCMRRHRYRVIHAHIAGNMAAVSCIVGRVLGKPVLVKLTGMTEMKGGILDPLARRGTLLRRSAMRGASSFQATSRRIAGLLAEAGYARDKILLLPNAVNVGRFAADSRDVALRTELCGSRQRVGIFVGRLEPEKGIELLVQGWARVFASRDDAALLLVGGGSLAEALKQTARTLGVESQLIFVGPTLHVERYLALADFGVLTSLFEGLSNSLLEYMAAGLPVIGSAVSGTEDWVIEGKTGWPFEPGRLDAFVRVLAEVAETPLEDLQRLGRQASDAVCAKSSIPAVVDQLQAIYLRLEHQRA